MKSDLLTSAIRDLHAVYLERSCRNPYCFAGLTCTLSKQLFSPLISQPESSLKETFFLGIPQHDEHTVRLGFSFRNR